MLWFRLFFVWMLVSAAADGAGVTTRVRPLDPLSASALDRGERDSARFRALLAALDESNLIVHVVTMPMLPGGVSGRTRFVSERAGQRYVRIELLYALSGDLRTAILGHELQHACELAESDVRSTGDVRTLFERIGSPVDGTSDAYDTAEARSAGSQVWADLRRRSVPSQ